MVLQAYQKTAKGFCTSMVTESVTLMWVCNGPCGVVALMKSSLAFLTPLRVIIFGSPSVDAILRIEDNADCEMNGIRDRNDAKSSCLDLLRAGGILPMEHKNGGATEAALYEPACIPRTM